MKYPAKGLICRIEDCTTPVKAKLMCAMHYYRNHYHGDPLYVRPYSLKEFNRSGYRMVYCPTHPNAGKGGCVGVHTVVMSELLGRPIRKGESVHHKNGLRHDNRPENLELWVKSQPSGQRVIDLIEYAHWVLDTYEEEARGWNPKKTRREQHLDKV